MINHKCSPMAASKRLSCRCLLFPAELIAFNGLKFDSSALKLSATFMHFCHLKHAESRMCSVMHFSLFKVASLYDAVNMLL